MQSQINQYRSKRTESFILCDDPTDFVTPGQRSWTQMQKTASGMGKNPTDDWTKIKLKTGLEYKLI